MGIDAKLPTDELGRALLLAGGISLPWDADGMLMSIKVAASSLANLFPPCAIVSQVIVCMKEYHDHDCILT